MRKLVLFACIALFGLTSLAAVNLPKTIKDIPIFPGAKVDADKNQGESTSKVEDSAAAYQDALASAKDQRDPDAIQAFEETIKAEYSNYYCDASPEEVVAWYLKKFGDVKNEEPTASSLEIGGIHARGHTQPGKLRRGQGLYQVPRLSRWAGDLPRRRPV